MAKEKTKLSAKAKAEDLRGKSPDELKKQLVDLKKQQFNLRFQKAGGQLNNTSEVRVVRRQVARLKTIAAQKINETAAGAKAAPVKAKAAKAPAKAKTKAKAE